MNKILYFLIPIGMAWALLSNSGGAAAVQNVDRTSSPLGVGSCGSCHSGGNYSPVISVELLDNNTVVNKYSPGKLNQVSLFINREGTFYGQCSELCGVNHGFMPIVVEAVSLDKYLAWVAEKLA